MVKKSSNIIQYESSERLQKQNPVCVRRSYCNEDEGLIISYSFPEKTCWRLWCCLIPLNWKLLFWYVSMKFLNQFFKGSYSVSKYMYYTLKKINFGRFSREFYFNFRRKILQNTCKQLSLWICNLVISEAKNVFR